MGFEALAGIGSAIGLGEAGAGLGAAGLSAEETALALGGGAIEGLGAPSAALTVNALPGAAAGAGGFDIGGLLGGVGSAIGGALMPSAGAAPFAAPGVSSNAPGGVPGGAPGTGPTDPLTASFGSGGIPSSGGTGQGASAFAPAPGVQLPGGVSPDATSASAFTPTDDTFATRAGAVTDAVRTGAFDPVGSNFTEFTGTPGAPAGGSSFPAGNTPTASPDLGNFATPPSSTSAISGGGFDVSGNPIDPLTGSSNPQYPGGGVATQYDPSGATVGGSSGGAAPGSTNILGKLGQGAVDSVTKNPLGLALGAGGLGLSLMNANKQSQAVKNVQNQVSKQSATADQLASYALTGTVPPGSQAGIDKSIAEAKANAVSNTAGQGLPTDPTKNTALAATLAKIDAQGPIIGAHIAQFLLQSGATYAGLSDQLYTQLAQIDQSQRASMGKAIANFAAALNTGGGTRIQIGGTAT